MSVHYWNWSRMETGCGLLGHAIPQRDQSTSDRNCVTCRKCAQAIGKSDKKRRKSAGK